jgi:hypothetical protein
VRAVFFTWKLDSCGRPEMNVVIVPVDVLDLETKAKTIQWTWLRQDYTWLCIFEGQAMARFFEEKKILL